MHRIVKPELLDYLPATDSQAIGSRADIRRVNTIMGHAGILTQAFREHSLGRRALERPLRIVELGAGDGTLMFQLARRWSALGLRAEVTLVDRLALLSDETRSACAALGWQVQCLAADVFAGLAQAPVRADVILANLFLHHFDDTRLKALLEQVAAKTSLFIACEPRRAPLALAASHLVGCIGCNAVTRYDAVVSVRAGFAGKELTALWPGQEGWCLGECMAGLFSHRFVAHRRS